jgi:hypothetical protein
MASNMNPMQFIQFIRNSGNPQQFVINMLEQRSSNNPMMANLLDLAKKGDTKGIEEVARNACKEQGKDYDKEFANFRQMLGL